MIFADFFDLNLYLMLILNVQLSKMNSIDYRFHVDVLVYIEICLLDENMKIIVVTMRSFSVV